MQKQTTQEILQLWEASGLRELLSEYPNNLSIIIWKNYSGEELATTLQVVKSKIKQGTLKSLDIESVGKYTTGILKTTRRNAVEVAREVEQYKANKIDESITQAVAEAVSRG